MQLLDNGVRFWGELHCELILGEKYIPMGFVEKCDFAQFQVVPGSGKALSESFHWYFTPSLKLHHCFSYSIIRQEMYVKQSSCVHAFK